MRFPPRLDAVLVRSSIALPQEALTTAVRGRHRPTRPEPTVAWLWLASRSASDPKDGPLGCVCEPPPIEAETEWSSRTVLSVFPRWRRLDAATDRSVGMCVDAGFESFRSVVAPWLQPILRRRSALPAVEGMLASRDRRPPLEEAVYLLIGSLERVWSSEGVMRQRVRE